MKKNNYYFYIIFTSLAIAFSTIESLLPKPFIFIKIGFANIITIFILYKYGIKKSFIVLFVRIIITSLLLGTFLSPSFILSLFGGLSGFFVSILFFLIIKKHISPYGISVIGSFSNNLVQLFTAIYILGFSKNIFYFLPYLSIFSIITGLIIGFFSSYLINKIHTV